MQEEKPDRVLKRGGKILKAYGLGESLFEEKGIQFPNLKLLDP